MDIKRMDTKRLDTKRLIPLDDIDPGAKDAGVALFIDHQLAGPFGRGAR